MTTDAKNNGHHIASNFIYGPVFSRRYGKSLGINLLPSDTKICNFDCIYCQLGWNSEQSIFSSLCFPNKTAIQESLNLWKEANSLINFDAICVGGNGEPTLNPSFFEISSFLSEWKTKNANFAKLICLTNGTKTDLTTVQNSIPLFDEFCVKMDAAQKLSNKHEFDQHRIINNLKGIKNLVIQSCFFDGSKSNINPNDIDSWLHVISKMNPIRVDIYTISRNTPHPDLIPASPEILENIASIVKTKLGFCVRIPT